MALCAHRLLGTLADTLSLLRESLAWAWAGGRDARHWTPAGRARPRVEELSARTVPALYVWNVATGAAGNFETAANWITDGGAATMPPRRRTPSSSPRA